MIIAWIFSIMWYKKIICPIHHRTRHIDSSSFLKDELFISYANITLSGHNPKTCSLPPYIFPHWHISLGYIIENGRMDVQVMWGGIKPAARYIFLSVCPWESCVLSVSLPMKYLNIYMFILKGFLSRRSSGSSSLYSLPKSRINIYLPVLFRCTF